MLKEKEMSNLIYIKIIGSILGGYMFANISERWGNKYAIVIVQVVKFFIPALALLSIAFGGIGYLVILIYTAVFLTGIFLGGVAMGFTSYRIDITREEERSNYMVLQSIITFPFAFLKYFAGIGSDKLGFSLLFIICISASIVATALSFKLKSRKQLKELNV